MYYSNTSEPYFSSRSWDFSLKSLSYYSSVYPLCLYSVCNYSYNILTRYTPLEVPLVSLYFLFSTAVAVEVMHSSITKLVPLKVPGMLFFVCNRDSAFRHVCRRDTYSRQLQGSLGSRVCHNIRLYCNKILIANCTYIITWFITKFSP